jgi:hypothetical protein
MQDQSIKARLRQDSNYTHRGARLAVAGSLVCWRW